MFGLDTVAGLAGGLMGGGSSAPSSAKGEQSNNSLSSGGGFNVGGGKAVLWLAIGAVVAVAAFFLGRASK